MHVYTVVLQTNDMGQCFLLRGFMEMPFVSIHSLFCDCLQGCLKRMSICIFNSFSNPPFESFAFGDMSGNYHPSALCKDSSQFKSTVV